VLREGKDPGIEAHKLKRALIAAANTSFRSVAEAWFEDEPPGWSTSHAKRVKFRIETALLHKGSGDSLRESRCVDGSDAQARLPEIPYDELERI